MSSNTFCDASLYEDCIFTQSNRPGVSSSTSFLSSLFISLTSSSDGGAIYFSVPSHSLSVEECIFLNCHVSAGHGGAIYINSDSNLSITSSSFSSCKSQGYGGAIFAYLKCNSSVITGSNFFKCKAGHGGGVMTWNGPSSSVSSSRFISCHAISTGGGVYHDSGYTSSFLTISDSLFSTCSANYTTDEFHTRGGGAFEDFRSFPYTSTYSFLFFDKNVAKKEFGYDISVVYIPITQSSVLHCFTTTSNKSFRNKDSYVDNWLILIS